MDQHNAVEQTLVLIKPDALKNSLTGYVLSQLSEFHTGLWFAGAKIVQVSQLLAEEHYAEHRGKVFFPSLLEYIQGVIHYSEKPEKRRVIALVYQGPNAVKKIRELVGPTNPHAARDQQPGSIRALGTVVAIKDADGNTIGDRLDNLIHASANPQDAEREIKVWFRPTDMPPSMQTYATEVSDAHYYYKAGRLYLDYEPGCAGLLSPGDLAWESDLEALRQIHRNEPSACTLGAVAAKYMINERQEG